MKSLTEQLWFEVPARRGFVNITGTVEDLVRKSAVQEGLCLVNAMHITASVFINDEEEGLKHGRAEGDYSGRRRSSEKAMFLFTKLKETGSLECPRNEHQTRPILHF